MKDKDMKDFIGKTVSVFVRYGFKKKIEETQSYQGILCEVGARGIILERKLSNTDGTIVNDFFPWHNIDAIRYRPEQRTRKIIQKDL